VVDIYIQTNLGILAMMTTIARSGRDQNIDVAIAEPEAKEAAKCELRVIEEFGAENGCERRA
jgi:hypothetical protein